MVFAQSGIASEHNRVDFSLYFFSGLIYEYYILGIVTILLYSRQTLRFLGINALIYNNNKKSQKNSQRRCYYAKIITAAVQKAWSTKKMLQIGVQTSIFIFLQIAPILYLKKILDQLFDTKIVFRMKITSYINIQGHVESLMLIVHWGKKLISQR